MPVRRDLFSTLSHNPMLMKGFVVRDPNEEAQNLGNVDRSLGIQNRLCEPFGACSVTIIWLMNLISRICFEMCFDYSLIVTLWGSGQPSLPQT